MCSILDKVPELTGKGGSGREGDDNNLIATGDSHYRLLDWRQVRIGQALSVFEGVAKRQQGKQKARQTDEDVKSEQVLDIEGVMEALEGMGVTMQRDHVTNMVREHANIRDNRNNPSPSLSLCYFLLRFSL
jgi:hypothetical protein